MQIVGTDSKADRKKQRDDNKKNGEMDVQMDGWWVDSFLAKNTVRLMNQYTD